MRSWTKSPKGPKESAGDRIPTFKGIGNTTGSSKWQKLGKHTNMLKHVGVQRNCILESLSPRGFPNMGLSPPRAKPQSDWFQDVSSLWHIHSFETILLDMICCYWFNFPMFLRCEMVDEIHCLQDIQWTNGPWTTPQNPWDNRNKRQDTAWHKFLHQTFERSSFDLAKINQDLSRYYVVVLVY